MSLELLDKYESLWLFIILLSELLVSSATLWWIIKEFKYDQRKDEAKAHKKTRTTKKTTQTKDGGSVVEESTEVSEPVQEEKT